MVLERTPGASCCARSALAAALLLPWPRLAAGGDPQAAMVSAARDNSFLVQEAYNQDEGVVQSILSVELASWDSDERDWLIDLSQEWPLFSSDHQVSFVVPVEVIEGNGDSASGIGDVGLAYRYQLVRESERWPALAPAFQLSLPTGDESDGLGNGSVGYQLTLPLSKVVSDRIALHANAGASYVHVQGADLDDYSVGASAVYALAPELNLLLEWVAASEQSVDDGRSDRDFVSRLSPGTRYALTLAGGQLVLGLAAPIGTTSESPDWGVFVYVSFERRLWGGSSASSASLPAPAAAARARAR